MIQHEQQVVEEVPQAVGNNMAILGIRNEIQQMMAELRREIRDQNEAFRAELRARFEENNRADQPAQDVPNQLPLQNQVEIQNADQDRPIEQGIEEIRRVGEILKVLGAGSVDRKLPSFGNKKEQHPVRFIEELEGYFEDTGVREPRQLQVAISCLTGIVAEWAEVFRGEWNSFARFRTAFLTEYWSTNRQEEVRRNITMSCWDAKNGKMSDHYIRQVNRARHLDPPLPEWHLVQTLARHFPLDIERGMVTAKVRTNAEAIKFLREMDETAARRSANQTEVRRTPETTNSNPVRQPQQQQNWRAANNQNYRQQYNGQGQQRPRPAQENWRQRNINEITVEETEEILEEEVKPEEAGNE